MLGQVEDRAPLGVMRGEHSPAPPAPPLPPAPAPVPNPVPAPARPAKLSTEEAATLEEVQREIWKGERPLVEILGSYGLTEATWRALKRTARRT